MSQRLPIPGQDNGTWGDILNAYLEVSLASDGTLNPGVVGNAQLDSQTQTIINSVASKYVKPGGGIPLSDLAITGTASSSNYLRGDGTWTVPAAGVTLDSTSTDIVAGTVTGSGVAGSVGKAADAGHQHPLQAHDHTTTNKGGNLPIGALSATGTASSTTYLRGDGSWTTPAAGVTLDSTSTDIVAGTVTGSGVAGSVGKAADAGHQHPLQAHDHSTTNKGGQITPTTGLSATGTASSSTYLRGDNTWSTVAGASNATTSAPGLVQLSNDLGGSATAPQVTTVLNGKTPEHTDNKDIANGYAGLDGSGLLKTSELPSSVVSGSLPSGGDDTSAINAALATAASTGAHSVKLLGGTYRIQTAGGISIPAGVTLEGSGSGTIISQEVWGAWGTYGLGPVVSSEGSIAAQNATLSVDTAIGNQTLAITSTASLVAGGVYLLGCDTAFGTDSPSNRRGELVRIQSVDSGTQVTLSGLVRDIYTIANNAGLQPVTFNAGVGLRNLKVINSAPTSHTSSLVEFYACSDVHVEGVDMSGSDEMGLGLINVLRAEVSNCSLRDFTDNSGANQYGYGIYVGLASEDINITGCNFARVRHAVTCDGSDNKRGVVRSVKVVGCTARETTSAAFDTHCSADDISYTGCTVENVPTNAAFQVRARNQKINGCSMVNIGCGVLMLPDGHGVQIVNNSIRRVTSGMNGYGILLRGAADQLVQGNYIDSTYSAGIVLLQSSTAARIINNTIVNSCVGAVSGFKGGVVIAPGSGSVTDLAVIGNTFLRDTTQLNPGEPTLQSLSMLYGIFNGNAGTTMTCVFANNTSKGVLTAIVSDVDGNTSKNNVMLDKTFPSWRISGSKVENFSRTVAIASAGTLASGTLQLFGGLILQGGVKISTISFVAGGTGATTPTHIWGCLVDQSLNVLAKTNDDTGTWGGNSTKQLTFPGGYTPLTDTAVYAGLVVVAAGMPTLMAVLPATVVGQGSPIIAATSTTGLTDPTTLGSSAATLTANNLLAWTYLT